MDHNSEVNFNDIDPDYNFFHASQQSNYFSIPNYIQQCSENPSFLNIMTYNVRSFHANSDYFLSIFDEVSLPDVLVLTETWFTPDTSCDIPGFHSYHTFRSTGGISIRNPPIRGDFLSGGISIFVKDNLYS